MAASALGIVLATNGLAAQDHDRYRDLQLGSDVATVSRVAGIDAPEMKVIHQRPALLHELTWRPRYVLRRSPSAATDATDQIACQSIAAGDDEIADLVESRRRAIRLLCVECPVQ